MDKIKSTLRGFKYALYTPEYTLVHGLLESGPEKSNHDMKPQKGPDEIPSYLAII
jgi:hypothetical protein